MTDVKSQQKADRLKAALKENLKRRKAQARGRQAVMASGNQADSLSVSAERDKPSD
ncbi:MAG: hypothetical protein K0Q80_2401 [Microvirga sp.]|jgi:hypothetical protein|nr:hypothetical protein [Microvirga sp.]